MTDATVVSQDGVMADEHPGRFAAFEREVSGLRLRSASGERRMLSFGIGAIVVGFVLILLAWYQASGVAPAEGSGGVNKQLNYLISYGLSGVGLIVVGGALFVRYSLGQYLRYWIVRQVAEQQAQTDRIVAALEKVEHATQRRP